MLWSERFIPITVALKKITLVGPHQLLTSTGRGSLSCFCNTKKNNTTQWKQLVYHHIHTTLGGDLGPPVGWGVLSWIKLWKMKHLVLEKRCLSPFSVYNSWQFDEHWFRGCLEQLQLFHWISYQLQVQVHTLCPWSFYRQLKFTGFPPEPPKLSFLEPKH